MKHQNKIRPSNVILFFAVLLLFLAASPPCATAQTGGGTPATAIPLRGQASGSLQPNEQHWFLAPQGESTAETPRLDLTFSPTDQTVANFIGFKVFSEDDTQLNLVNYQKSEGHWVWTADTAAARPYYIQVVNNSDFAFDYVLSWRADLVEAVIPPPAAVEETKAEVAVEENSIVGTDPGNARALTFNNNVIQGSVGGGTTAWFEFSLPQAGTDPYQALNYTLFFTPDDGNRRHKVNFELYPYSEFKRWQQGETLTNFGAGMLIDRDGDNLTGERFWSGNVIEGDKYLLAISNGNDITIDYWLFDEDIINPILGPLPLPKEPPFIIEGAAPQTAQSLLGLNKGSLAPNEERWYAFRITDFDEQQFEELALTMITTPDDGNRIRRMTFDVFTAGGVQGWSAGDNSQINNIGTGSLVYRDDNEQTGERFWHGWVIDNELYYVQIRNGTDVQMDYWLFTDDVYGP